MDRTSSTVQEVNYESKKGALIGKYWTHGEMPQRKLAFQK